MISAVENLEGPALNPPGGPLHDGKPGTRGSGPNLVERLVKNILCEAFHSLRAERDRERLGSPHVREPPTRCPPRRPRMESSAGPSSWPSCSWVPFARERNRS